MARVPRCQRYGLRFFWGGPGTNGAPALRTLGVDVALFFGSDSWKYEWPVLFDI